MAVSYKGLVIKFGGETTELQKALKDVQKVSKDTQADLRDIDKALQFDPGNTELLQQKVKALNSAYKETQQRLDAYKQALGALEAKKQSGVALTAQEERQYDSIKRAIMQCERQLESYGDALKSTAREAEGSRTALYKMGQAIQDNADKIASAGTKVQKAGTALSAGVVGAATAVSAFVESQEESIQQAGQLETAFQSAGSSAETAQSVYASFYRLLGEGDTATEASQNLIRLTQDEQELQQWTNIAAGAYATFGDALPLENLAEAAQETAHTATVVGGMADALNWSTASADQWSDALSGHAAAQAAFNEHIADGETKEDAFNAALEACADEQERASLITETLTGLYGAAGAQYQETNADLLDARDAQNELNQSMRELGEAALPVKQAVTEIATELIGDFAPALETVTGWYKSLTPEQQGLVKNLVLGTVAFGGVATAAGKAMQAASGFGGVLKTAGTIIGTTTSGVGGLAASLTGKLAGGWTGLVGLISANPIGLGVTAVAAATAGLTWFFTQTETGKQMWSDFTGFLQEKWEGVKDFFSGAGDFFGGIWDSVTSGAQGLVDSVGEKWEALKQNASDKWESLKQGAASAFGSIKQSVSDDMEAAKSAGSSAASALTSAMSGDWSTAKAKASEAFETIRGRIGSKLDAARSAAVSAADKIGDKLGFSGLGSKVGSVFDKVRSSMENPLQTAWNTISGIPGKIMNAFGSIKISIPTPKLPHFNVSWSDFGPVKIPRVSLSWYAKGGIFDSPSVIGVGEAGREAVLPIDRLSDLMADALQQIGFNKQETTQQVVSVSVSVTATVADSMDAYTTGQQIGLGIASRLKQRGVRVATA